MATTHILALDQGTTGSTALIVSIDEGDGCGGGQTGTRSVGEKKIRILAKATVEFPQHYPQAGWVEHDLEEIWRSMLSAIERTVALAGREQPDFSLNKIAGIGITNQRETICFFERGTGLPVRRAIVWQCRRSADICNEIKANGSGAESGRDIQRMTGLVLDPYFSGSKVRWIMENDSQTATAVRNGKAVIGTIDSYLLHRLTGGKVFATEPSNASRTMLFNIVKGKWDEGLLKLFKVPSPDCLAEVRDSAGVFGKTAGIGILPDGIPIAGILGDQQAALAGQTCFAEGDAKCTYGTGAFLLANTGDHIVYSEGGLLTTVAWSLNGKRTYALEGSCFIAGAAVQFLRDQLGFIGSSAEIEALASKKPAAPEIYFVPALAGLGAPYWDAAARGAIFGMTRGTSRAEIARAVLEGIAFQVQDVLHVMEIDARRKIKRLRVDGGATANNLLMQIQSDFIGGEVERPVNLESTALGAAMFAGLGVKAFGSIDEISSSRTIEKIFMQSSQNVEDDFVKKQISGWQRAVAATRLFAQKS